MYDKDYMLQLFSTTEAFGKLKKISNFDYQILSIF